MGAVDYNRVVFI